MSVVAFTFGSLGDIITLLQLVDHVRKALYNTKDSSTEFRDVILELDSVVYTVTEVQRTLSLPGSDRLSQSVENALYLAMGLCLDIIAKMNERIAMRRMASRGAGSVGAMAIDTWQRIGWTLFKKEELLELRRRLSGQIEAINTLLALAQGDRMNRIGSQVASVNAEVACVSNAVAYLREESREPYVLIREIHRCVTNLPHKLGYLWEGDPGAGDMPVTFTDISGHTVVLPWELVTTEELLHEFLLFYFRDKLRLWIVQNRRYRILNLGHRQQQASFQTCKQLWFYDARMKRIQDYVPGSKLVMRMRFITRKRSIRRPSPDNIPSQQLTMTSLGTSEVDISPRIVRDTARLSINAPNSKAETNGTISRADSEIAGNEKSIQENNDEENNDEENNDEENYDEASPLFVVWGFPCGFLDGSNAPSKDIWCGNCSPPHTRCFIPEDPHFKGNFFLCSSQDC